MRQAIKKCSVNFGFCLKQGEGLTQFRLEAGKMNNQDGLCLGCMEQLTFWSFQETSQAVDQAGRQEIGRRQERK